jgi:hypothetical protein
VKEKLQNRKNAKKSKNQLDIVVAKSRNASHLLKSLCENVSREEANEFSSRKNIEQILREKQFVGERLDEISASLNASTFDVSAEEAASYLSLQVAVLGWRIAKIYQNCVSVEFLRGAPICFTLTTSRKLSVDDRPYMAVKNIAFSKPVDPSRLYSTVNEGAIQLEMPMPKVMIPIFIRL